MQTFEENRPTTSLSKTNPVSVNHSPPENLPRRAAFLTGRLFQTHKFFFVSLFLSLLTACQSQPGSLSLPGGPTTNENPWAGTLRALDLADTTNPAYDITAIYLRQVDNLLQIRVDLLAFRTAHDLSLDIKIGDDTTPERSPLTVHIPAEDNPARIALDPLLATVIVELPLSEIPSRPRVDVSTPEEEITGLRLDSPSPSQTAPVLLTFYDTFAGRFPAEALRSWDGAHTGPRGERHGLKHLLDAAQEYQTPIVLLDLKEPQYLSALDAMGMLPRIQQMEQEGILILPDNAEQGSLFGLSPSQFGWGGTMPRPTFTFSNKPSHIYQPLFGKTSLLPVAIETESTQPASNGASLEVRRALLESALNIDGKDLLVLGGSLRDSTWGSPDWVGASLAYFDSRPYIQILTADDLLDFPKKLDKPELQSYPLDDSTKKLEAHYKNLTQPVLDFAADWNGTPFFTCEIDIDQDNQPECVLANKEYLAILDPRGARVSYLFTVGRIDNPPYTQLIGPSWQVAVGLSDPSSWDLSAGEAADPGAYPGAFSDVDDPFKPYEPVIEEDTIVFSSLDGTRTKIFSLNQNGIEVQYKMQDSTIAQISLLVDPETRFTPGWAQIYVQEKTPGGIAWGLENGPMVKIQAQGSIMMRAFNDSLSLLANPEDPDFDYPAGYYIPFPMAIAEIEMQDGYFLRLERLP